MINGWPEHTNSKVPVLSLWTNLEVEGRKAYVMKERFRLLKHKLRVSNREVFGNLDLDI